MQVSFKNNDYIFNKKEYEMDNIKQLSATGVAIASFIGSTLLYLPCDSFINKKLVEISKNLDIHDAVKKGIEKDKALLNTNFRLFNLNGTIDDNKITEEIIGNKIVEKETKIFTRKNAFAKEAAIGKKSSYLYKENVVFINLNKMGATAFHKIGHALLYYKTKYGHLVRKTYVSSFFAMFIFSLTALLKKPQNNEDTKDNKSPNIMTKIKNNVTKLVALSFIPILLNEAIANHKGYQLAKNVCPKKFLNKVKMANRLEFSSYLIGAIITVTSIHFANKLRNYLGRSKN